MRTYPDAVTFALSAAVSVLEGKRFLNCLWELTYRCNARCTICSYWKTPGKPRAELTIEEIGAGLDRIYRYGTRLVNFTGGEPTLRPDLEAIVRAASRRGLWTSIVTNGSRLTRERIRGLRDAGLDNLLISFDSLSSEIHDGHRGIPGLHDHVVRSLEWLREEFLIGHRSGGMMCVLARHNASSVEEIVRFADTLGVYVLFQPYHANKTGDPKLAAPIGAADVGRIVALKDRYSNMLNSRSYLAALAQFYEQGPPPPCHAGFKYFSVDPYGYVHPCVDMPAVGHILRDDIAAVRSERAQAMVDGCRGCWYCFRGEADTSLSLSGCVEKARLAVAVTRRNARTARLHPHEEGAAPRNRPCGTPGRNGCSRL
jgi:MoaA/NifB/PqqE/SkfB family radical SAM enzyme